MKKRVVQSLVLALVLLLGITGVVLAQTYLFKVDKEVVNVFWNKDGTVELDYVYVFSNDGSASPIDFVDLGMPNSNYSLGNMVADVDGKPITDIQDSEYVKPGIALGLGRNAIPAATTGTVHAHITGIEKVLYPDDKDKNYVSGVFAPNYFDHKYVNGSTDLTVIFHLPPGVTPEEPRYHLASGFGNVAPEAALDENARVTYTWHVANSNAYSSIQFGASFPAKYVPDGAVVRPNIFSWIGTVVSAWGSNCCCFLFIAAFFAVPVYSFIQNRKRRMQYLPPKISIEGHGIKRGLTAVEAAIIMETPIDKVMTMILFAVIKKGLAVVKVREPLDLEVKQPLPADLQPYEQDFLQVFIGEKSARKTAMQATMVKLVKSVSEKMKGFSLKESVAYYKDIMQKAWAQVEAANTPEVKGQAFDQNMEWTMLDHDFGRRSQDVFHGGPVYVPMWWGSFDPGYHPTSFSSTTSRPSIPSGSGGSIGMPSLPTLPGSDFAASFANGVTGFAGGVVGDITGFTQGITKTTNPPPVASSSSGWKSGGGGGGHSCACACACAGCACACAGGGR